CLRVCAGRACAVCCLVTLASLLLRVACLRIRRPPLSSLFPYTTLFRSRSAVAVGGRVPRRLRPAERRTRARRGGLDRQRPRPRRDRKSTRLNSSHEWNSYAVFCVKKKNDRQLASAPTDYEPLCVPNLSS